MGTGWAFQVLISYAFANDETHKKPTRTRQTEAAKIFVTFSRLIMVMIDQK
jgi:hypothetical protein